MATGLSIETIQAALAGAVRSVVNEVPKFDGQGKRGLLAVLVQEKHGWQD